MGFSIEETILFGLIICYREAMQHAEIARETEMRDGALARGL